MKNAGLFSTLFLETVSRQVTCADDAQGRFVTLGQSWQQRDASTAATLWSSFIKAALGNLGFVTQDQSMARGFHPLYEDYGFRNRIGLLYLIEPGADLDDQSVGRFWPAKLVTELRERKLNWGILSDGAKWRLYSTKSAKPFEDHVELDLATALEARDETSYALFERFFHADSFVPMERDDYDTEKAKQLKAQGLKAKKQKRASSGDDEDAADSEQSDEAKERQAGIYLCQLDLDGELSEAILEARVKEPLLAQVDNVLRFICNGFIADTPRAGEAYTEEERREVFESSVKLLYRCLFLFYAEARQLLPSEDRHAEIYAPRSIRTLCREARKFRWNERGDNDGYDLWKQLKGLAQAVNEGDIAGYGIAGYNGGLFDDEEEKFLGKHRLRNDFLANALYWLAYVDPGNAEADAEYPIPYEDLEVRHLGEMYESILEFKVRLADTDYLRRRTKTGWQTLSATGQRTQEGDIRIKAGDIFFGETALERKQSGSYYTPESLVRFLVEKAVIAPLRKLWETGSATRFATYLEQAREGYDDAARRGAVRSAEELVHDFVKREVLTFKVCDLAMGSGHFLVAASNLMADFVAGLFAQIEPLPGYVSAHTGAPNHWRRHITRHCLYGADLNPLAVNLAKLALWLNCFARDHKLTFLDHHLRCGNSLIGLRDLATLKRIPLRRTDTKKVREEIEAAEEELPLGLTDTLDEQLADAARTIAGIAAMAEDDTDLQREAYDEAMADLKRAFGPLADLHTAYLMDSSIRPAEYARMVNEFAGQTSKHAFSMDLRDVQDRVASLAERHDFFHWPLEFPDVFGGELGGGFSATIGNPPWDGIRPLTQEFYSAFDPDFRSYEKQKALRVAERLREDPRIAQRWSDYEKLVNEQKSYFVQPSVFPAVGSGELNTYKLFLNLSFVCLRKNGHLGVVVPSGLYTDQGCKDLRMLFFGNTRIQSLYCFENRWPEVFTAVDGRFKFITLVIAMGGSTERFRCAFMKHDPSRLVAIEGAAAEVSLDLVKKLSPDGLSVMEFPDQMAAEISEKVYASHPLLGDHEPGNWNCQINRELHTTDDSHLFKTEETGYRIYEGKMIHTFDHLCSAPTYWISETNARSFESGRMWNKAKNKGAHPLRLDLDEYRVAFRKVAASTNERTCLSTLLPQAVITSDSMQVIRRRIPRSSDGLPVDTMNAAHAAFLASILNSLVCDFILRMKVTINLSEHFIASLPIPRLGSGDPRDAAYFWPVVARALRLVCTTEEYADLWAEVFPQLPADTLEALATAPAAYGPAHEQALRERLAESYADLDDTWIPSSGLHDRKPDRRDDGDRAQTRAELDALIAHLYGLTREEFAYILDTFPVLRRKELAAFGEYQSKRKALEEFERFQP